MYLTIMYTCVLEGHFFYKVFFSCRDNDGVQAHYRRGYFFFNYNLKLAPTGSQIQDLMNATHII
jgi:hypothetical protein